MYVSKRFRGLGIARKLLQRVEEFARNYGYHSLYLDTLIFLKPAHRLYYSRGFVRIPPYNNDPYPYVLHLRKDLF